MNFITWPGGRTPRTVDDAANHSPASPRRGRLTRLAPLTVACAIMLSGLTGCGTLQQASSRLNFDGLGSLGSARLNAAATTTGTNAPNPKAASIPPISPVALVDQQPTGAGQPASNAPRSALDVVDSVPVTQGVSPLPPLEIESIEEQNRNAAGLPTDPLRPETTLNLYDKNANKDLWGRVRKGFALPELDSELVAEHQRWYAARPDYVQRMAERANRYLYHVVEEVERRQMPTELALLPFIESAFNPQALSSARASGIWQFMPATGKDYELTQNLFRDDRRDVLASTRAALDHLQRLHKMFGDWHLVLAAYNWGEGNVQRAMARNSKAGLPTDYLSLNMPPETRHYVPKLHAVRNIVARPDAFNLALPGIENHPYFVSMPLKRDMDVTVAARLAEMPVGDFQALNPSMNKPVILAAGTPQILLPYTNAEKFVQNLARNKAPLASWTAWVVPRTMRPNEAARLTGMAENSLRDINKIPPKMLVKAGSTLLVPRSQSRTEDVSEHVADNAMMALAPDLPPMKRMTLKAGRRDTVASIAARYKVSAAQVAQWNKVGTTSRFSRGQSIVVFVPVKGGKSAVARTDRNDDRMSSRAKAGRHAVRVSAKDTGRKGRTVAQASTARSKSTAAATRQKAASKVRVASR
jgi:membrane-bound lytic murein transglycosylase D